MRVMTTDEMRHRMVHATKVRRGALSRKAKWFRQAYHYEHKHEPELRFGGPVEICKCSAWRNGRGRPSMHGVKWIEGGAARYTVEAAEHGSRLAQRALAGEYQYARN